MLQIMPQKTAGGPPETPDVLRGGSGNAAQNLAANIDDVRHMEEKMLRLLEEFESGKVASIGM